MSGGNEVGDPFNSPRGSEHAPEVLAHEAPEVKAVDAPEIRATHEAPEVLRPINDDALHTPDVGASSDSVISQWNARQWIEAGRSLDRLLDTIQSSGASVPDTRMLRHLRGICAAFEGNNQLAKMLFDSNLERLSSGGYDAPLSKLAISSATWLGDVCLLLLRWDDAALAYSIACAGLAQQGKQPLAHCRHVFGALNYFETGSYRLGVRQLTNLHNLLTQDKKAALTICLSMPRRSQINYVAAAIPYAQESQDTAIAAWDERPSDIILNNQVLLDPWTGDAPWTLEHDSFLLLDPRKFEWVNEYGRDVHERFLSFRFLPNLHNSKIFLKAVFTTKRGLAWLVNAVQTGLAARGMCGYQFYNRMRVIRVREFGLMDYVSSFVIVFIKLPGVAVFSVQVEQSSIREKPNERFTPHPQTHHRIVVDLKDMLNQAEEEQRQAEGTGLTGSANGEASDNTEVRSISSRRFLLRNSNFESRKTSVATTTAPPYTQAVPT